MPAVFHQLGRITLRANYIYQAWITPRFISIIFSFLLSLLFACHGNKDFHKETLLFNGYMESTFSKPLSGDSVTYIVMSDNCCHSCFDATKNLLDNKNCIFILGKKNAQKCSIANGSKINVLVDNSNNVNQIKYTKDNIAFIKTYKGLIYSIDAPEPLQIIKYIENTSHN